MNQLFIVSSVLLWILVVFNLLLTLALVRRLNSSSRTQNDEQLSLTKERLQVGQPAPDFIAQTIDGEQVERSSYAGRAVVFLFVSTNCGPCLDALPGFKNLAPKAALSGVDFVLVSGDSLAQTQTFIEEFRIHLPILVAPIASNTFFQDYKSLRTPSYCLVDKQGVVQAAGTPSLNTNDWKQLVDTWERNEASMMKATPNRA